MGNSFDRGIDIGFSKTGLSSQGILTVVLLASVFQTKAPVGILLPMLITADNLQIIPVSSIYNAIEGAILLKATRMEAFSDGVLAIIITIMVLELKVPAGHDWNSLSDLVPKFISYAVSFTYVGIYWNNHHHLLHTVQSLNGRLMWINLLLLFWLSLVPFSTAWIGESGFSETPTAFYGIILLFAAVSYWLLQREILKQHSPDSIFAVAIGKDFKGKISPLLYLVAIGTAYLNPWISCSVYVLVAAIWFLPDRRVASILK